MELRPALEGFAGIPQDTRNTYKLLAKNSNIELSGHLLSNNEGPEGYKYKTGFFRKKQHHIIERQSGYILSISSGEKESKLFFLKNVRIISMMINVFARLFRYSSALIPFLGSSRRKLFPISYEYFSDFIWRGLFSKSLSSNDIKDISRTKFYGQAFSWVGMGAGVYAGLPFQSINTKGFDYYLSQTPLPAKVSKETQLIVRYHDALPLFMPHTISNAQPHKLVHYKSLVSNVNSGALFVCNSENSKNELLTLFPHLKERISVVYCCVADVFFPQQAKKNDLINIFVNRVSYGQLIGMDQYKDRSSFIGQIKQKSEAMDGYFLAVGTMEPRKNYNLLISAWMKLRAATGKNIKLVIVGNKGWNSESTLNTLMPTLLRAEAFLLERVPLSELRQLYSSAIATIVPSLGEGFSYSGVESMKCGGMVLASNILVHKEVYKDAAKYFSPYSPLELCTKMLDVLNMDISIKQSIVESGYRVSNKYSEESVSNQWSNYFDSLS